jgi:hypothetical protein
MTLDAEVAVALVSSFVSFTIAVGTALWTTRDNKQARALERELSERQQNSDRELALLRHELEEQVREREDRTKRTAEFASYRDPLLDAADELQHRLYNITSLEFLSYLNGPRHDTAIQTTLFRMARYFGMLEILYTKLNYLKFEKSEETAAVAGLLAEIGRTFASDNYDRVNGFETSRFMVWREEQRAMGETAIDHTNDARWVLIGYADFVERLGAGASKWFRRFVADLKDGDMATSERIRKLTTLLSELVRHLDTEGRFIERPPA